MLKLCRIPVTAPTSTSQTTSLYFTDDLGDFEIPGIILLGIAIVALVSGGSIISVLGAQALALLIWTGALGMAIRRKWPTKGVSETIQSHKWCGPAAVFLMLVHVLAAVVVDPTKSYYFIPFSAPPPGAAGSAGLIMGLTAFCLGYYKKHTGKMSSERWKLFHGMTAVFAVLFGLIHTMWLENLIYDLWWQLAFFGLFVGSSVLVTVRLR